jgi:hypothetical protein
MTAFLSHTLTALAVCRSPADFYRTQIAIQESATPAEVAVLMQTPLVAPAEFGKWMQRLWTMMTCERSEIQQFRLRRLSRNILHYSGGTRARALVVGFCGKAGVLFMPIPAILQYFTAGECDVLVVRDPARMGFVDGMLGYADSFSQMIERLRADADMAEYEEIRTFGTSGGGAAALAGGVLLNARRAVCFCGHLPSSSGRYGSHAGSAIMEGILRGAAPLTKYYCAFGDTNANDANRARDFEQALQVRLRPIEGVSDHNVIFEVHKKRGLVALFNEVGLT